MFWFDKKDPRALYVDNRNETHTMKDRTSKHGQRSLFVQPDLIADFRALPFEDNTFPLVVFDPPHILRAGRESWMGKKYGALGNTWREDISQGFVECFRVLRPLGTLIFKWNESAIPVSQILNCTPHKPLFGNQCGKLSKTHWIVFMKGEASL